MNLENEIIFTVPVVNFHTNPTIFPSPSQALCAASINTPNCGTGQNPRLFKIARLSHPAFIADLSTHCVCVCVILHTLKVHKVESGRSRGSVALQQAALTRTDQRRVKINRGSLI